MFTEPARPLSTTPELYIFSTQSGTAKIVSLNGMKNESIQLSKGENTHLFNNSVFTKNGIEQKGVYVNASVPIVLYPFQRHHDTSEGYLAIPKQFLSNVYIVPSFKVYYGHRMLSQSLIGIVSTTTAITRVNIKLSLRNNTKLNFNATEFNNGDTLSLSLSELNTFQISHNYDLSGSIITSSHPVGVVSGNICNSITQSTCNHFTEMIPPTNQLDNNFIVPTIYGRISITRVYCPQTSRLHIFTSKREFQVTVQKEDFFEFEDPELSIIKSDNNVLTLSYPKDKGNYDSYMMTVYGMNQYKTAYDIIVPGGFTSYISMTFKSGSSDDFQIDMKRMHTIANFTKIISGIAFTTVTYSITAGAHTVTHQSYISFGLWIYGDRSIDGYGFPAGMAYYNYH